MPAHKQKVRWFSGYRVVAKDLSADFNHVVELIRGAVHAPVPPQSVPQYDHSKEHIKALVSLLDDPLIGEARLAVETATQAEGMRLLQEASPFWRVTIPLHRSSPHGGERSASTSTRCEQTL